MEGWFRSEKNRLAFLEFADGSKWDTETIEKLLPGAGGVPTEGDDVLHGTPEADVIDGLAGNDVIHGGDGDDILVGGKGSDVLRGEGGDDTYSWNLGDGRDLIVDSEEGSIQPLTRKSPFSLHSIEQITFEDKRKPIENQFVQSFLYYVPYVTPTQIGRASCRERV